MIPAEAIHRHRIWQINFVIGKEDIIQVTINHGCGRPLKALHLQFVYNKELQSGDSIDSTSADDFAGSDSSSADLVDKLWPPCCNWQRRRELELRLMSDVAGL
jgi:hypothetical protein